MRLFSRRRATISCRFMTTDGAIAREDQHQFGSPVAGKLQHPFFSNKEDQCPDR
jgi:hypothetical protein